MSFQIFSKKMVYIFYCFFKRPIPRTVVHNKNNPGKSECVTLFTLMLSQRCMVELIIVKTVAIGNACRSSQSPSSAVAASSTVQDVSIQVVQIASHLGIVGKKNCADLFIVCCFPDTVLVLQL